VCLANLSAHISVSLEMGHMANNFIWYKYAKIFIRSNQIVVQYSC